MEARLTQERKCHILTRHPYIEPHLEKVVETVAQPDAVTPSTSDTTVSRYYRKYDLETLGTKYLCVVVKQEEGRQLHTDCVPHKQNQVGTEL